MANDIGFWRRIVFGASAAPDETRSFHAPDGPPGHGSLVGASTPPAYPTRPAVDLNRAMALTDVYRAVQIITIAVGTGLVPVVRRAGTTIPTPTLVAQPDPDRSLSAFLKRTVTGMATNGNAFWRVYRRDAAGTIAGLRVINPLEVTVRYERGQKLYRIAGQDKDLRDQVDMVHLRLLEVPGFDLGLGPIQAARADLEAAYDLHAFSQSWLTEGGVPTGVLSTDQELDAEDARIYRDAWNEQQAKRQIAVLGRGLEYKPVLLTPEDAQFIGSMSYTKTQIATLFGIPPTYLNAAVEGSNLTYTNTQGVASTFWATTLAGYVQPMEDALSSLLPRGQSVVLRPDSLLRADDKTRSEIQKTYVELDVMSADEVRASEGMDPR